MNAPSDLDQEKMDLHQQTDEPQSQTSPTLKPNKKALSRKRRLKLARLKRLRELEERKSMDLEEICDVMSSYSIFKYRFKSIFKIDFNAFLISLAFIFILIFSSNIGLYLPNRFELTSLNTSLKFGFFEKETIFYPQFQFQRLHSKFYFYYQFKKKDDPFALIDSQERVPIEIIISIESMKFIKKMNKTILKYSDIDVQPLFDITLDSPTNNTDLQITFLGDLTSYKTFIIKSIVFNTTYLNFLNYYRFLFVLIGLIFVFHSKFKFLNFQNIQIIGYFTIMVNLPSMIFSVEKSTFGRLLQATFDQLFTKSLLIFWVYETCQKVRIKPLQKMRHDHITLAKPIVLIFVLISTAQMINFYILQYKEETDLYSYLNEGVQKSDKIFLFTSAFLIFFAYTINYLESGSMRLSLNNFFLFASQICSFCDDLIERCRVLKCIGMVKWMRLFSEFVAVFFIFVLSRADDSDSCERVTMCAIPLTFEDESSFSKK